MRRHFLSRTFNGPEVEELTRSLGIGRKRGKIDQTVLPQMGVGLLLGCLQSVKEGLQEGSQSGQDAPEQVGWDVGIVEQFGESDAKSSFHRCSPFSGFRSLGSYAANGQVFGTAPVTLVSGVPTCAPASFAWTGASRIPASIPDGTSNTIFWTEKLSYCDSAGVNGTTRWAADGGGNTMPLVGVYANKNTIAAALSPNIVPQFNIANPSSCIYYYPSSMHTAALLVGLGDGSVRSITSGISQATFNLAMIPSDGLPMPSDW